MKWFLSEEICSECDDVMHIVFNSVDFEDHKVGRIKCKCGHIEMPCNDCPNHTGCFNCPWGKSRISAPMTDEDYVRYLKKRSPVSYQNYKKGNKGEYYQHVIEVVEQKDKLLELRNRAT